MLLPRVLASFNATARILFTEACRFAAWLVRFDYNQHHVAHVVAELLEQLLR
jgi:hypothetical protein